MSKNPPGSLVHPNRQKSGCHYRGAAKFQNLILASVQGKRAYIQIRNRNTFHDQSSNAHSLGIVREQIIHSKQKKYYIFLTPASQT